MWRIALDVEIVASQVSETDRRREEKQHEEDGEEEKNMKKRI